jgi:argininosuccinate lyase
MKGLPLSYNRDMQLDKEPLFSVVETMKNELSLLCRFLPGVKVNVGAVKAALSDRTFYATELAEWMVREKKVPFKKAHEAAGLLIKAAESSGKKIEDMKDAELRRLHPAFNAAVIKRVMDPFYAAGGGKRAPEKKSGGVKPAGLKPPAVEL